MNDTIFASTTAENRFVESGGRTIAYRETGEGRPIVLCNRFRGNLDTWDPLFLDSLAAEGFRVIWFDYSGLGLSTGEMTYQVKSLAGDALQLIHALDLDDVIIGGWSLGGYAAQAAMLQDAMQANAGGPASRISCAALLGTGPAGKFVKMPEQLFYDTAVVPDYGLEEEVILFFEPESPASRAAAKASIERIAWRTEGLSKPVPLDFAKGVLGNSPSSGLAPEELLHGLQAIGKPILHIAGDHDIMFPVENWYALNRKLSKLHLVTFPHAGHGPHHQHPETAAKHIAAFAIAGSA